MKFGSKPLGKSLVYALMVVFLTGTGLAIASQTGNSQDIRGRAEDVYACSTAGALCGGSVTCCAGLSCQSFNGLFKCASLSVTPSPSLSLPSTSVKVVQLTSGTCAATCIKLQGSCLGVGYDAGGTNGQIMSFGNYTSCQPRTGACESTVKRLSTGKVKCAGIFPEWTSCRCQMNPFAGT